MQILTRPRIIRSCVAHSGVPSSSDWVVKSHIVREVYANRPLGGGQQNHQHESGVVYELLMIMFRYRCANITTPIIITNRGYILLRTWRHVSRFSSDSKAVSCTKRSSTGAGLSSYQRRDSYGYSDAVWKAIGNCRVIPTANRPRWRSSALSGSRILPLHPDLQQAITLRRILIRVKSNK